MKVLGELPRGKRAGTWHQTLGGALQADLSWSLPPKEQKIALLNSHVITTKV